MMYSARRYVIVELDGVRPEWMLNALNGAGIPAYDAKSLSPRTLRVRLMAKDFKKLRALRRTMPFRAHIVGREGLAFRLLRLRNRAVLVFGGTAMLFLAAFLAPRILVISVDGCAKVPEKAVRRLLADEGVRPFALKDTIEVIPVADRIRAADDRIAWLGIELDGVSCRVEIVEAVPMGEKVDYKTPCDVVAKKSGAILSIEALNGLAAVKAGESVKAGDVLIKGHITDPEAEDQVFVHARGEVAACVYYRAEAAAEAYETALADTGNTAPYRLVRIGSFKAAETRSPFAAEEVRELIDHPPVGTLLPLTVTEGKAYEQAEQRIAVSREERIVRAAALAESRCYDKLPREAAILTKNTTYEERDGVIKATCLIVTKESIGVTKEIQN